MARKAARKGKPRAKALAGRERKPRSLLAAVQAALQRMPDAAPGPNARKIDLVADFLVAKACAGDVQAIKAVFERIDGRAGAEADAPQSITIIHTFKSDI